MFKCKTCSFEATSGEIMADHVQEKHIRKHQMNFSCDECEYNSIIENNVIEHKKNKHQAFRTQNVPFRTGSEEKKRLCIFWNHGYCRNNDQCRFVHEEIKACHFQNKCRKFQCPFYHNDKSLNTFLGRSPVRNWSRNH